MDINSYHKYSLLQFINGLLASNYNTAKPKDALTNHRTGFLLLGGARGKVRPAIKSWASIIGRRFVFIPIFFFCHGSFRPREVLERKMKK